MKYQKHYLSDDKSPKYCPLQGDRVIQCDSFCAWFDHENLDCKLIGSLLDIKYELRYLNEKKKGDRDGKREFKH